MTESEYPHWKEALFGNGHVANLWCAIKYGFWHTAHLLLAVIGVLVFVLVKAYKAIKRVVGAITPDSAPSVPTPNLGVKEALTSETASDAALLALLVAAILVLVGAFIKLVLLAIAQPLLFLATIGGLTLALALLITSALTLPELEKRYGPKKKTEQKLKVVGVTTSEKAGAVKQKSKETPGLRRLLGYCPVKMNIEPKWFESFADRLEDNV